MLLRLGWRHVFVHNHLWVLSLISILRVSTSAVLNADIGGRICDAPLTIELRFGQLVDHEFDLALGRVLFTFSERRSHLSLVHAWAHVSQTAVLSMSVRRWR